MLMHAVVARAIAMIWHSRRYLGALGSVDFDGTFSRIRHKHPEVSSPARGMISVTAQVRRRAPAWGYAARGRGPLFPSRGEMLLPELSIEGANFSRACWIDRCVCLGSG